MKILQPRSEARNFRHDQGCSFLLKLNETDNAEDENHFLSMLISHFTKKDIHSTVHNTLVNIT